MTPPIVWTRHPVMDTGYANYTSDQGFVIRWCGHPTASFKYWLLLPDGSIFDLYNEGGITTFRTLRGAKTAAAMYLEEHT